MFHREARMSGLCLGQRVPMQCVPGRPYCYEMKEIIIVQAMFCGLGLTNESRQKQRNDQAAGLRIASHVHGPCGR